MKKKESSKVKGKMSALKGLHKMASDMMGSELSGLKKVSVLAKDKKGLKKGLKKAEDMMDANEGAEDDSTDEC